MIIDWTDQIYFQGPVIVISDMAEAEPPAVPGVGGGSGSDDSHNRLNRIDRSGRI